LKISLNPNQRLNPCNFFFFFVFPKKKTMGILGILTPLLYDSTENSKGSVVEIEKN
jgi:hypothetical protein